MNQSRTPRVSAIINAYNCAEFVADAIESVLAQTRPVDEIVVIDDGSTDETAAVVARYAASVRYVGQENRGLSAARNRGIGETTGDLIAFLDCDDLWLPDKVRQQVAYLMAEPEVALVSGHAWGWEPERNRRWLMKFGVRRRASIARELLIHNVVGNSSIVMVRRSVLGEVGLFDPQQCWAEDWDLWMRIVRRGRVGFINAPLIVYRSHSASLTHQNTWQRYSAYYAISCQAISAYRPAWWRPLLLARAWSRYELRLFYYAAECGMSRSRLLRHAGQALLAYPFDETIQKVGAVVRALGGQTVYRRLRSLRDRIARSTSRAHGRSQQ